MPLDAVGVEQAHRAAAVLVRDASFGFLAYSPSKRAAQTAAIIRSAFDLAGRPLPAQADERFMEIDVGEWAGLTQVDVAVQYPQAVEALGRGEDIRRGVTGETLAEASERVRAGYDDALALTPQGQATLIVTHGAVIRGLAANLVGFPSAAAFDVFAAVRNCHWAEFAPDAMHGWRVEAWNRGVFED